MLFSLTMKVAVLRAGVYTDNDNVYDLDGSYHYILLDTTITAGAYYINIQEYLTTKN